MNFDLDDPLAGILSDGSDDSFFDDDVLGGKKSSKKKETPIAQKKKDIFDIEEKTKPASQEKLSKKDLLFGLDDDIVKKDEPSSLEAKGPNKTNSDTEFRPIGKKLNDSFKYKADEPSISKTDLDDSITFTKSPANSKLSTSADKLDYSKSEVKAGKPLQKGKSSQSLIDDILGGPLSKPTSSIKLSTATRPTTASKQEDFDLDSLLGKSESKLQTTQNKPFNKPVKTAPAPTVTKSEIVQKADKVQPKKLNEDWLGVFKTNEDKVKDVPEMPAWLGGGEEKKKKEVEPIATPTHQPKQEIGKSIEAAIPKPVKEDFDMMRIDRNLTMPPTEDAAATSATMYLQQQESQLMVALQLKAQEEKLAAIQQRHEETARFQRESSRAHHDELEALLRRQTSQRKQMQEVIAAHQDRITQRIKALLGTPKTTEDNFQASQTYTDVVENEESNQVERGNPYSKEKKQLLQLIQSLQENHDKEIDLMETSYRRQLAFLEISLNQAEDRMKDENDKLLKFYTDKMAWMEEHHSMYKKLMAENFDSLTARHQEENVMLGHQHLENIRVLQEHHANLMENLRNSVKQEQALIQDSSGFSSNLMELVSDVKQNKSVCQQLYERIQTIAESNHKDAERNVQIRETQIADLMQQLKRERDVFETEKSETRETVKLLESRLKQMTSLMEEETANLKQKRMEFEFEKATFNKQTEFAKNVLKKQDEEIKAIREDIQKEYQDKITKINEEKGKVQKECVIVVKEKSTIQHLREELERMKAELQMQLDEVSEDKSKINVERQRLHIEEQRISAKKRDLEMLAKAAVEKQSQADKKYSEAEFTIRKYEERMRKMQEQVVSLNSREKQIAKEKVTLSRERIMLHNERKQMENNCSLCRSSRNIPQYQINDFTPQALKDNAPNAFNMDTSMSAIESEMANILSRNFALRNLAVNSNINNVSTSVDRNTEVVPENSSYKDYMDPKFMMFRLDVQQVISNLDQNRSAEAERITEDTAEDYSHHSDVDNISRYE